MSQTDFAIAAPTLTTPRLILRAHALGDFAASLALWTDPVVTASIGGRALGENEVWQRLLRYGGLWTLLGYGYWAIINRSDGRFIGEAGLADWRREMTPPLGHVPETGWALHSSMHGHGLAHEAMQAVLNWSDRQLEQTCCIISRANMPSIRLAGRLGYRAGEEGRLGENPVRIFHRLRPQTDPVRHSISR